MQIIVLGMHRSGTSTVTGLLHRMGAYIGGDDVLMPATEANPRGYWERTDVRALNDRILESQGCRWSALAEWQMPEAPHDMAFQPEIHTILQELSSHADWVLKDPRLCLTWPWWKQDILHPVFVVVHRDPVEIARSLKIRDGIPILQGIALWEYHAVAALRATLNHPTVFLSYHDLLGDSQRASKALFHDLSSAGAHDLRLPEHHEITAFVTPSLNRSGQVREQLASYLNGPQMMLVEMMQGSQPVPPSLAVSDGGKLALSEFSAPLAYVETLESSPERLLACERRYAEVEARLKQSEVGRRALQAECTTVEILKASISWRLGHAIVRALRCFLPR